MKLFSIIPVLVLSATSHLSLAAENPNKCDTKIKERDGKDFVLTDQGKNPHLEPLAKKFAEADKHVSVAHVFDDGNHKVSIDAGGKYQWEKTSGFNDRETTKWVPQGITSTADAVEDGKYGDKEGWIVSWHRKDNKSVRVTFVDKKTKKYRHVLLVYPWADDNFKAVPVHAGGIVWYGDTLWVVDTRNGIRVFDMSNIWEVEAGEGVGKKSGGGYSAAGYKYVIPQIRWYKWSSSFNFQFSFTALDRTSTPDSILFGEWVPKSSSAPIRLAVWELDYKTRKLKADGKTAKAKWASCVDVHNMQGALQVGSQYYISTSSGDAYGWVPGQDPHRNAKFFPKGSEDLSYDPRGNKLYSLTETTGERYIVTSDLNDIKVA